MHIQYSEYPGIWNDIACTTWTMNNVQTILNDHKEKYSNTFTALIWILNTNWRNSSRTQSIGCCLICAVCSCDCTFVSQLKTEYAMFVLWVGFFFYLFFPDPNSSIAVLLYSFVCCGHAVRQFTISHEWHFVLVIAISVNSSDSHHKIL